MQRSGRVVSRSQHKRRSGSYDSVETSGVALGTRIKQLWGKREKKKEEVRCEVLMCQDTIDFSPEHYMRVGARKWLRMGMVLARVWEADGSSSRQEGFLHLSLLMEVKQIWRLRWIYPPRQRAIGRMLCRWEDGEGRAAWRKQVFEVQTSCAKLAIWASSGRSGALCCLKGRLRDSVEIPPWPCKQAAITCT